MVKVLALACVISTAAAGPRGACSAEDQNSLTDANIIGKKAGDCGKTAYSALTGTFDHDAFNDCFTASAGVSAGCSKCYAESAKYGASNCKSACLLGWCKQGCLTCTQPAQDELSSCTGFSVKAATPCLESGEVAPWSTERSTIHDGSAPSEAWEHITGNGNTPSEAWEHITGNTPSEWEHITPSAGNTPSEAWEHITGNTPSEWEHITGNTPSAGNTPSEAWEHITGNTAGHDGHLNSTWGVPYLDHLGDDCFSMCLGVTGKCPTDFCGTGGWCCRWGMEWDTPGCYNVGCHGKHCCAKQGDFRTLDVMV